MAYPLRWLVPKLTVVSSMVLLLLSQLAGLNSLGAVASASTMRKSLPGGYGRLPMSFEPNAGQTLANVKFLSRGAGYTLFLTPDEAVLTLNRKQSTLVDRRKERPGSHHGVPIESKLSHVAVHMRLVGAAPRPLLEGVDQLPGTVNYFLGSNPRQWRTGLHPFSKVKYHQVYPGIDLVYYGSQRRLEYDFNLAAGAQADQIAIEFKGTKNLQIDADGGLVLQLPGGSLYWAKPMAYQDTVAGPQEITCRFALRAENRVGFELGSYDSSQPLIIDPVLVYSTYLGGSDFDVGTAIAVNSSGNVYLTGDTVSVNFPTVSALDSTPNGSNDVFVAKLNPAGTALVYSTYLGGSSDDFANAIAIDSAGNAYVTGSTASPNFPTKNAYQSAYNGAGDVFLSKLGPFGTNLLYSTYIGGTDYESGNAVAVDNSGNAYVAGETDSLISSGSTHPIPFPTVNNFQNNPGGGVSDAFVAKFNTTLSGTASLVYSSFLGGSTDEKASGVAIDSSGNVYLTGQVMDSTSVPPTVPHSNFPVVNAFQPQFNAGSTDPYAGNSDGFVTKVNSTGSTKVFSTFLGGYSDDDGTGIAVDASGRVYVTGETASTNFPTLRAAQPIIAGNTDFPLPDAFVTVFQSNGIALVYSTFLGGSDYEVQPAIAVDQFGCVYVTGQTFSYDFPLTVGALQTNSPGNSDAFVAKINPAVPGPASLIYSTLFSGGDNFGNSDDAGNAIAVDANGNYYVAGQTTATNFPVTTGVLGTTNHGSSDAFVAEFSSAPDLSVAMVPSVDPVVVGSNLTYTIQVNNNGRSTFTGVTNQVQISPPFQIQSVTTTLGNFITNNGALLFNIGTLASNAGVTQTVVVASLTPAVTTNSASLSSIETGLGLEPNTGNNQAAVISSLRGIADIKLTSMTVAPNPGLATSNLTYTFQIDNKGPYPATSIVLTDALPASLSFVSANSTQGTWSTNLGYVAFALGTLANGTGATATIVAQALAPGVIINGAGVTAFELDTNPANNNGSTSVTVNYPAVLGIVRTGGNHVLYWSTNAAGFALQSTPALAATNTWSSVTNNPVTIGAQYMVTNTSTGFSKFYRLVK